MNQITEYRLVFTGDISFTNHFRNGYEMEEILSGSIMTFCKDADHVIGNVECALSDRSISTKNKIAHASDPMMGKWLADHGIDIWNCANNHMMDVGTQGVEDTICCAQKNGCQTIGIGNNLDEAKRGIVLGNEIKIGIISVAKAWKEEQAKQERAGIFTWDYKNELQNEISCLREKTDWVIVIAHGGSEFSHMAMPEMRRIYRSFLDMGADIVVAHHPHVVQQYETDGKKAIFYSLGNFIFDTNNQRKFNHTDRGMLVKLCFGKQSWRLESMPVKIDRENHRVEMGEDNPVFQNFSETEYEKLWPVAAKSLYEADKTKAKIYWKWTRKVPTWILDLYRIPEGWTERDRNIRRGLAIYKKHKCTDEKLNTIVRYLLNEKQI